MPHRDIEDTAQETSAVQQQNYYTDPKFENPACS